MPDNYRLDPAERAAVNGWADAAMPTGIMNGSRVGKRREDWVLGKMAEVAVCKALNVSPDFTNHADPGCDMDWCNCRLDVKATAHWHGNLVVAGDVLPGECDIFQACHVDINSNLVTIWGWQLAAVVFDDADRINNTLSNGLDRSYLKYPRRKLRPGVPAGWDMVIATRTVPTVYGNTPAPDENNNTVDVDSVDTPETQPDDQWREFQSKAL